MLRPLHICLAIMLLACCQAQAQDEVFSGPQPGEETKNFKVLQVNSPYEVEEVELGQAKGPTLLCFMHKVSEPALGLLINLEFYANQQEGLNHHYIMLTEDRAKTEQQLKRWAKRSFFQSAPFSLSIDGPEGPGDYGLNRNVTATILLAKDNKVLSNFALQDPNPSDAADILAVVAKTLGKPAPDFDAMRLEMRKKRDARRNMRMKATPIFKLAPNDNLAEIMWVMIHTEGDREQNAKKRSGQFLEWAGDNEEKLADLRAYCKAILEADIELNEFSKKAIQELSKDK